MDDRIPAEAFSAGEFIGDELEKRGWTPEHLAILAGQPTKAIDDLIAGAMPLTSDLAAAIAKALGWSTGYIMFIEESYQLYRSSL
jgi:plasmid maintenance system antidote protein VapI